MVQDLLNRTISKKLGLQYAPLTPLENCRRTTRRHNPGDSTDYRHHYGRLDAVRFVAM
jgi:hypothetical protein